MATMRASQVAAAGADFELEEREIPTPGFGEALVRVHARGVCHSDSFAKNGGYPGVAEAHEKMISGDARFRMVITTGA